MQDSRYERLERLGKGSYGEVFKAKKKGGSDEVVAVKYISTFRGKKELNDVRNEINIMKRLSHPHIIRFIESYEIDGYIVVVTECAKQELYKALTAADSFPENRVYELTCQLSAAVYYLHANRILHRDLKPENVLLMEDGTVKLCDFGFARAMGESYYATTIKRTPLYMAPEIAKEDFVRYNEKVDIWSLACIIYELFVGQPPFYSSSYTVLGMRILNSPVNWPNNMPSNLKDLLGLMLIKNPRERLAWPDILAHPWFNGGIKVSQEVLELDSPYTKPAVALQKEEEYYKKVRILGCGGSLGEDNPDGAKGEDDVDGDVDTVILIDCVRGSESPEESKEQE